VTQEQTDKTALLRSLEIDRGTSGARSPRRGPPWAAITAGVVLIAAAGGGALWWQAHRAPPAQAQTAAVSAAPAADPAPAAQAPSAQAPAPLPTQGAAPAAQARSAGTLVASGYVVARRMATVSAETFGKVTEVLVEEGMRVEAGQILARLDDTLAVADLELSKANVATVEAQRAGVQADLAEARRVLARARQLNARDFQTEAAVTNAESRVAVLTAELQRVDANLAVARLEVERQRAVVDKLTIRAPFAGMVVDKNAQPGEIISPNSAGGGFTRTGICTIVDQDSLEIEVDVNEAFINRVSAGQRAEAVLDAWPDWKIPARVIAVIPTANREKATIKVRIGLDVKDARVLRDMAAKVTFLDGAA